MSCLGRLALAALGLTLVGSRAYADVDVPGGPVVNQTWTLGAHGHCSADCTASARHRDR